MTTAALHQALSDFNNADAFFDHLADDVVVEFPYGPTLGLPARLEGKSAVRAHLSAVQAGGLTVHDPTVQQVTDTRYVVEYTGAYRAPGGSSVDVPLIALIDQDGSKIVSIREYWDTHLLANMSGVAA